ncbi:MAG: MBL fold metallo-hydrolase, partial [Planctomycetota bacterium]|nr:MBL fold metallo-hydrolase [Planctomycetota bacterium]
HYDHLDLPTLKRLEKAFSPKVYVGLGNRQWLEDEGLNNVLEMDWWHRDAFNDKVAIHFTPANHNSGRGLFDQDSTLWGSFVVESTAGNIYFAGDTAYGTHFSKARERLGPFRLSLIPIGAYEPRWFMKNVHVNPTEAVQAHLDLESSTTVGIHFGTFQLTDEALNAPIEDLAEALKRKNVSNMAFRVLEFGEGRLIPPCSKTSEKK